VKRIIFSQYNDNIDQNTISTNQYKLSQFRKYSNQLEQAQREYADRCGAEYVLHRLDITDYDTLQFEKILQLERYAENYDQILYLDFDVVPNKRAENIFEVFGNTLAMYPLFRDQHKHELKWNIEHDAYDRQNVYCKTCAKNSMLILDDGNISPKLYNTGVTYGSSDAIKNLKFGQQLDDMKKLLDETLDDSIYPDNITKNFFYNNEVFITYLVERNSLQCTDMYIHWNFILDGFQNEATDISYFTHHVNKEFELSFP
jgi:hypothetical protein